MMDRLAALALVIADQAMALEELRRKLGEAEAERIRLEQEKE